MVKMEGQSARDPTCARTEHSPHSIIGQMSLPYCCVRNKARVCAVPGIQLVIHARRGRDFRHGDISWTEELSISGKLRGAIPGCTFSGEKTKNNPTECVHRHSMPYSSRLCAKPAHAGLCHSQPLAWLPVGHRPRVLAPTAVLHARQVQVPPTDRLEIKDGQVRPHGLTSSTSRTDKFKIKARVGVVLNSPSRRRVELTKSPSSSSPWDYGGRVRGWYASNISSRMPCAVPQKIWFAPWLSVPAESGSPLST